MKRIAILLCAAGILTFPSYASAHTTLISSNPAHDSVIESWPNQITLTFGEPLQVLAGAKINKVSVTNANAQSLEGETTVNGAELTVAVRPNTIEGPVLINYRIAAADGHILDGEYSFSYKKGAVAAQNLTQPPHHGSTRNLSIIATSTILIVLGLIFGLFTYRRRNDKD